MFIHVLQVEWVLISVGATAVVAVSIDRKERYPCVRYREKPGKSQGGAWLGVGGGAITENEGGKQV